MSKYTTELRYVVEQSLDDLGLSHNESNWYRIYDKLGLDDYPMFSEAYRPTLNNKIIRHYYTREIGAETVGRFRMFVRDSMHMIMPYYNQLYESEIVAQKLEPLLEYRRDRSEHAEGSSQSHADSKADSTAVYQDTPQNEMIPAQIKNLQYATDVNIDDSSGSSDASGSYDNTVDSHEEGFNQSQAALLLKYRETFLNIDMDIVYNKELAQCFMTIW